MRDTYSSGGSTLTAWSPIHDVPRVYGKFLYDSQLEEISRIGSSNTCRVLATSWTSGATISGNLSKYDGGSSPSGSTTYRSTAQYSHPTRGTRTKIGGNGNTHGSRTSFAGINLKTNTTDS